MPNWCQNRLFITGMPEDVAALAVFVASTELDTEDYLAFSFRKICPITEEFDTVDGHTAAWGTKWDLTSSDLGVHRTWDSIEYSFETAWAPPIPVTRILIDKFPALYFRHRYVELGNQFAGELTYDPEKKETSRFTEIEGEPEDFSWCTPITSNGWADYF